MKTLFVSIAALSLFLFSNCTSSEADTTDVTPVATPTAVDLEGLEKAYFASGCFWCVEAIFESVEGVHEVISGYSGGSEENPTYEQVSAGRTGHAEAVEVYYDPEVVSYETLLVVFFASQDPTTPNQQGPDRGRQYRSAIFFRHALEQKLAKDYIQKLENDKVFDAPIVTELVAFDKFWEAEDYHQNFERLNPNQGYVQAVSVPRLRRFQEKHPELLKKGH